METSPSTETARREIYVYAAGIGMRLSYLVFKLFSFLRDDDSSTIILRGVWDPSPTALETYFGPEVLKWTREAIEEKCSEDEQSSLPLDKLGPLGDIAMRDQTVFYASFSEMLESIPEEKRGGADAWLLVGTANHLHRDLCVAGFEARVSVFCEKPLCVVPSHGVEIMNAYRKAREESNGVVRFATGFVLRYAPLYVRLRELLHEEKVVGKIVSFEANELLGPSHGGYIMRNWRRFRELAGSMVLEKCCHDLDIILWMTESLPRYLSCYGGRNIFVPENAEIARKMELEALEQTHNHSLYTSWDTAWEDVDPFLSEKDIEDNFVIATEMDSGVRGTFHFNSCAAITHRRLHFVGLEGVVEADLSTGYIHWARLGQHKNSEKLGGDLHGGGDSLIMKDIRECMSNPSHFPKASGEEGFRSAVMAFAADQSRDRHGERVEPLLMYRELGLISD